MRYLRNKAGVSKGFLNTFKKHGERFLNNIEKHAIHVMPEEWLVEAIKCWMPEGAAECRTRKGGGGGSEGSQRGEAED